MTKSGEGFEDLDAIRRLQGEIRGGFVSLGTAILAIGVVTLPLVLWWTRDFAFAAFACLILAAGGGLCLMRFKLAGAREMRKLLAAGRDARWPRRHGDQARWVKGAARP